MRVLFARMPGDTRHRYKDGLPHTSGLPRSGNATDKALKQNYGMTMNKGNMFIGDAAARLFDVDRGRSCFGMIEYLHSHYGDDFPKAIRDRFDLVVFSMANMIRPNQNHQAFLDLLEKLDTPFMVLGAGMQVKMPSDLGALSDSTRRVLEIFNERALVFGVRGSETKGWLDSVNLTNTTITGCPSLYVYPHHILSTRAVVDSDEAIYATAGYLERKTPRATALINFFRDSRAEYIFQEEIFHKGSDVVLPDLIYNDATGECDRELVNDILEPIHATDMPFRRYWYFQDVEAWRQLYSHCTAYIGDRFHAGVGALQTGTSALVIYKDLRVHELTDFFGIPKIHIDEISKRSRRDVVDQYLSDDSLAQFHRIYSGRVLSFIELMGRHGVKLYYPDFVLKKINSVNSFDDNIDVHNVNISR